MTWYTRLIGRVGEEDAKGASKHARGRQKPKDWKRIKRQKRLAKKAARKANR